MFLEVKYSLGDVVWFVSSNSVRREKIKEISCVVDEDAIKVLYNVGNYNYLEEDKLFNTKEELLKEL